MRYFNIPHIYVGILFHNSHSVKLLLIWGSNGRQIKSIPKELHLRSPCEHYLVLRFYFCRFTTFGAVNSSQGIIFQKMSWDWCVQCTNFQFNAMGSWFAEIKISTFIFYFTKSKAYYLTDICYERLQNLNANC